MKYGFYVSGRAGRLKLYLKESSLNIDDIAFVLIDNKYNDDLRYLCQTHKIPYYEYSYKELNLVKKEQNNFISNKLFNLLTETKSEYCFVFGHRILQGELLDIYENRLVNFHPSVLPSYKGYNAIDQALNDNALILGNTAHFITSDLDGGAIIMQSIVSAHDFEGYDSILNMQILMLKQIVEWLKAKRLNIVAGKVEIEDAVYKLGSYIPNIEIE